MKSKQEIIERLEELESRYDPDDGYSYLDEEEQTEIATLMWVLDGDIK